MRAWVCSSQRGQRALAAVRPSPLGYLCFHWHRLDGSRESKFNREREGAAHVSGVQHGMVVRPSATENKLCSIPRSVRSPARLSYLCTSDWLWFPAALRGLGWRVYCYCARRAGYRITKSLGVRGADGVLEHSNQHSSMARGAGASPMRLTGRAPAPTRSITCELHEPYW